MTVIYRLLTTQWRNWLRYCIVYRVKLVRKLVSFFVCFCSRFLLFVGLDRAQNSKCIEIQMNN